MKTKTTKRATKGRRPKTPAVPPQLNFSDVPRELFEAVRAKAARDGVSVRGVVLNFLKQWTEEQLLALRTHRSFADPAQPEGVDVVNENFDEFAIGQLVVRPQHVYRVTRVDERGAYGVIVVGDHGDGLTASEPHTIGMDAPTAENDPAGRFPRIR